MRELFCGSSLEGSFSVTTLERLLTKPQILKMRAIDECAALTRTRGGKQRGMKRNEETFHCEPAEASMLLLLLFHALLFFFSVLSSSLFHLKEGFRI